MPKSPHEEELKRELARLRAALAEKDEALAEKDEALAEKDEALAEKDEALASLGQVRSELEADLAKQTATLADLQHQLKLLLRQLFGRRAEKIDPNQLLLAFSDCEEPTQETPPFAGEAPDEESPREPKRRSRRNGRVPLPDHLPRERVEVEPSEADLSCDCGQTRERIGEEVSEILEYVPASFKVIEVVRPRLACSCCDGSLVRTALPPRPIDRGRPGPGLLAEVCLRKYGDHLPLARLSGIFARHEVDLPRSTLCDWVADAAALLKPIAEAIREEVLAHPFVQTDETGIRVRDPTRRPQVSKGRIWCLCGPPGAVFFMHTPTKEGHWLAGVLKKFKGYVQADAYNGFDRLFRDGSRIEVGCWAHARRKFYDAKDREPALAGAVLLMIRELFLIERRAREKELTPDEVKALRQRDSKPVLTALLSGLEKLRNRLRPKHPLQSAIGYALNQRAALEAYLKDGRLCIDNNRSERSLRQVAVGRKNWLFAGSRKGAERAAVLYSLIVSCREIGVEPGAYLKDVLSVAAETPLSQVPSLTPRAWQAARTAESEAGD